MFLFRGASGGQVLVQAKPGQKFPEFRKRKRHEEKADDD